jgi:5'-AMP-activated protein kinase catalytic alpha subunit
MYFLSSSWQSRAHPREIMTEVLKALQELNVCWKKIGHYNMKCRWIPGIPGRHEGMMNNPVHNNHYFGDESTIIENDGVTNSPNIVKFEVQVICSARVFLSIIVISVCLDM